MLAHVGQRIRKTSNYLGLAVAYTRLNFNAQLEYRGAFISQVAAMFLNDGVWVAFWSLFFTRFQVLRDETSGWRLTVGPVTDKSHNFFRKKPLEIAAYIQDKIEFEGMVLNAGVRLDYLNPMKKGYDATFPLSDAYPTLYNGIYPSLPGAAMSYERWQAFRTLLDSPAGWPTSANRVQAHLSPRLGVSFPITESSKLYFNYGHFYQRPPISFMYNTQLNPSSVALPTPDLDMARTVSYELGYEQMLGAPRTIAACQSASCIPAGTVAAATNSVRNPLKP